MAKKTKGSKPAGVKAIKDVVTREYTIHIHRRIKGTYVNFVLVFS